MYKTILGSQLTAISDNMYYITKAIEEDTSDNIATILANYIEYWASSADSFAEEYLGWDGSKSDDYLIDIENNITFVADLNTMSDWLQEAAKKLEEELYWEYTKEEEDWVQDEGRRRKEGLYRAAQQAELLSNLLKNVYGWK